MQTTNPLYPLLFAFGSELEAKTWHSRGVPGGEFIGNIDENFRAVTDTQIGVPYTQSENS